MSAIQTLGTFLAIAAGFLVGLSTVLQKKGLLQTKDIGEKTGNKREYLKNVYWWFGMLSLALGEIANFVAYALTPAIIVAPLMAVSVVVSAVMSVIILKEKINFTASAGIILCLLGSTIIVLHGPMTQTVTDLRQFIRFVLAPGFLAYTGVLWAVTLYLVFKLGPRYGPVHPAIYLTITAVGSAYLISSSQGFGVAIIYSVEHWQNDNQLLMWEFYVLGAFVVATIIFQIDFLNRSLRYFSASIVTPLNFVFMSTVTLITTSVLYQGFQVNTVITAITIIIGFLVIVLGVTLILLYNLKLSKVTAMEEQKIQDEFGNPIDWNLSDDNPFSMLNKTYSLHSVRIEPLGDDHHNVADIERSRARRKSYSSLESKTPADPHFASDESHADDGGSN